MSPSRQCQKPPALRMSGLRRHPNPPPHGRGWAEDWSDPSKLPQVSALWPLLWLTIPLVLLVLYGYFTRG